MRNSNFWKLIKFPIHFFYSGERFLNAGVKRLLPYYQEQTVPTSSASTKPVLICMFDGKMPHGGNKRFKHLPCVKFDGKDRCLVDLKKGTKVRYKFFDLAKTKKIILKARGRGEIFISCGDKIFGNTSVTGDRWKEYEVQIEGGNDKSVLTFIVKKGKVDILDFTLSAAL